MLPGPDYDRQHARFDAPAAAALLGDDRRIVIVGARGWIGLTLLNLLHAALGAEFARRVVCFGSAETTIALDGGITHPQHALADVLDLGRAPTMLFHLAFLTKDKVAAMSRDAYVAANRTLSDRVFQALEPIGVDRLFVASSGAAAFADDPAASADLQLYGRLKRDDEHRFAAWALADPVTRNAVIGRIYSVSGPWINKLETYALASFILDALAQRPIVVRAPHAVLRSYVPVREVLSLVMMALLDPIGAPVLQFDTGGETLELGDVAAAVARVVDGQVVRRAITAPHEDRYAGDDLAWRHLLAEFGLMHVPIDQQIAETAAWLARETHAHAAVCQA